MHTTDLGLYDGTSWERLCQQTLKIKLRCEGYQEVPASPGDFGIDGFTKDTGRLYQCFCPEKDYPFKELYENQRDKITEDIKKLVTFANEISKILAGTIIKEWIFLVPSFSNKDLLVHCNNKTAELKQLGLSFISPNIKILIQDYQFLHPELEQILKVLNKKIDYRANLNEQEKLIGGYQGGQPSLIDNARKKHRSRFKNFSGKTDENKLNGMIYNTVRYYLAGEEIKRKWEDNFEEQYTNFSRVISNFESEVEDICLEGTDDGNARYMYIRALLNERIRKEFGDAISLSMIEELSHHVIADWILRCPLSFD